jgi:DNA-directed RNA polymerase specialized sigma24 family protein
MNERSTVDPLSQLEREWPSLAARIDHHLQAWRMREPVLAPFATSRQLVRSLHDHDADPRGKDAVLAGLLRLGNGDPAARRLVLQALLPGLKTAAAATVLDQRDRDDLVQLLLGCAWERICAYPLERRPARIAANLLRDTRSEALRGFEGELKRRRELPERPLERVPDEQREVDLEAPLKRAVAANAITAQEAELILRSRIDDEDLHALAREAGVAYNTLAVRRLRAEKRLLLFLGQRPVNSGGRKPHSSYAGAVEDGLRGSAGRGAVTHLTRRR